MSGDFTLILESSSCTVKSADFKKLNQPISSCDMTTKGEITLSLFCQLLFECLVYPLHWLPPENQLSSCLGAVGLPLEQSKLIKLNDSASSDCNWL